MKSEKHGPGQLKMELEMHKALSRPQGEQISDEYRLVLEQLGRRGFWLSLPEALEAAYCREHDRQAALAFASTMSYVFVLYLALGFSALLLTSGRELGYWPVSFGVFLIFIMAGWLLSFTDTLHRYYQPAVATIAGLSVAAAVVHPHFLDKPEIQTLVHQGTIYVIVVVYLALNLRLKFAVLSGTVAGVLALLVLALIQADVNWYQSISTFGGGSALGFILCFREEKRNRTLFLQARLLELDNERIQTLADELERLSFIDGLTGVANRRYFDDYLDKAWRQCQRQQTPMTLMMIDVDFFKPYNDAHGHQKGDQCLRDLARALTMQAARPQDLAARYGGEEFVLLFPDADEQSAGALADRVLESVRELQIPHGQSEASDVVTISAGVVTVKPGPLLSPHDLVAAADRALYQAKSRGRDNWQRATVVGGSLSRRTSQIV